MEIARGVTCKDGEVSERRRSPRPPPNMPQPAVQTLTAGEISAYSPAPSRKSMTARPARSRRHPVRTTVNTYLTCRIPVLRGIYDQAAPRADRTERKPLCAPPVSRAATVRDGIRKVVGSDCGRHRKRPGASMSVGWRPIGRACQQPAFAVSDVGCSQRTTRNSPRYEP